MVVIVYKWGGISFDDKSLIKTLLLPSTATGSNGVTFHDEDGNNYQVPGGKVFIVGKWAFKINATADIGESDTVDTALSRIIIRKTTSDTNWYFEDILGIFAASKWVTGYGGGGAYINVNSVLHGVEIDA